MDCSPTWLLSPWDSPGKNTGVGSHSLLQEISLTQGSNSGLLPEPKSVLLQILCFFPASSTLRDGGWDSKSGLCSYFSSFFKKLGMVSIVFNQHGSPNQGHMPFCKLDTCVRKSKLRVTKSHRAKQGVNLSSHACLSCFKPVFFPVCRAGSNTACFCGSLSQPGRPCL